MIKYEVKTSTGHLIIAVVCLGMGLFFTLYSINLPISDDCKYIPIQFKENCDKIPISVKEQANIASSLIIGSIFFIPCLFEFRNWRKESK